jgi:hypothetical protein
VKDLAKGRSTSNKQNLRKYGVLGGSGVTAMDLAGRGISAGIGGIGGGVAAGAEAVGNLMDPATARMLGLDQGGAARLGRDIAALGNTALTLSGATPVPPIPVAMPVMPRNALATLSAGLDARAANAGVRAAERRGMTPERAALAEEGTTEFGLPLTAKGKGETPRVENQRAFNREVAKTFGEDANALTPEVMSRARKRIGKVLEDVESRNSLRVDNQFMDRLAEIEGAARDGLVDYEFAIVDRQINNILGRTTGDFIPGRAYGNLLHRNAALDLAWIIHRARLGGVRTRA